MLLAIASWPCFGLVVEVLILDLIIALAIGRGELLGRKIAIGFLR